MGTITDRLGKLEALRRSQEPRARGLTDEEMKAIALRHLEAVRDEPSVTSWEDRVNSADRDELDWLLAEIEQEESEAAKIRHADDRAEAIAQVHQHFRYYHRGMVQRRIDNMEFAARNRARDA